AEAVHSPEELRILVEQAEESGTLEAEDARMIDAVFEFSEKSAREVMTPRTQIVALPADVPIAAALVTARESGFSRFPAYEGTIDDVVGMVLVRDLLWAAADHREHDKVRDVMRHVHVVPGTREVEDVLADFKRQKEHLAIVLDEFGGTAGLVTMEDLLEEIVGDIRDELDESSELPAASAAPGETLVDGASVIADVNERYGVAVPDADYTTIGGYVFGELGRLPVPGDRVERDGVTWIVRTMAGRRIETLALLRPTPPAAA
ncbi:MAG: hemolysin family protein, partial [Gemmatimonadota bacterium]|nr:hemolysin family protein [Gemmatimonadota bacterium]